jgi:hypothetical protein
LDPQQLNGFHVGLLAGGQITADGNGVFFAGLCRRDCRSQDPGFVNAIMFNDQIILKTGDIIAGEAELIGFQRWSANDRGDVIFVGRYADGIDRIAIARRVIEPKVGDLNNDNALDLADVFVLSEAIRQGPYVAEFDWVSGGVLDQADLSYWIGEIKRTYIGDADLNGEFNSSDLVRIFTAGGYEDNIERNATWIDGDFNGDREFGTSDLVIAFQDSGYERGPRTAAVPEPTSPLSLAILCIGLCFVARTGKSQIGAKLVPSRCDSPMTLEV